MKIKLLLPDTYRRNSEEVSIRNLKAHFLSILAGTAHDSLPSLLDILLSKAEITINLLRQYTATTNFSAYAHLSGPFDYNKMPLSMMGMSVQVHKKQKNEVHGHAIK